MLSVNDPATLEMLIAHVVPDIIVNLALLLGIIVLLQVLNVVRFGLTTFAGAAILATGISILTAAMYDSVQGTPSRTSVVWGLGVALIGCLAFMSGLEVFSGQIVDIIRKSTVGVLLLVLGLAVLVRGGERK